jgi:hypothetical protein
MNKILDAADRIEKCCCISEVQKTEMIKILSELADGLNLSYHIANNAMRRFDDVDIDALSDHDMAWTARIIVREYRNTLTHLEVI